MSEIAKKIMEKVNDGTVQKIPKWKFVFKRVFIWISLIIAIILGAFAVSMMMFQVINVDWDLLPMVAPGPGMGFAIFKLIPYFWLLIAILLFVFVYFDFKNTRKGYRYSGGMIVGGSLLVAFVLGAGIYFFKTPEFADEMFLKVPFYEGMHAGRDEVWNVPEKGVIAGMIIRIDGDKIIVLNDMIGNAWEVNVEQAKFGNGPVPRKFIVGDMIKAVGKITGPGFFEAEEIRPLRPPR
ncbi:MAG: hypothetical protein WC269_03735 [Candidatus Gracilibacteria bacterium]|jgi:predicted secreted protein